jgi:hypothetical protein
MLIILKKPPRRVAFLTSRAARWAAMPRRRARSVLTKKDFESEAKVFKAFSDEKRPV